MVCVGIAMFGEFGAPAGPRPAGRLWDIENDDLWFTVLIGATIAAVATCRTLPDKYRFPMNRCQTNELKGWMQLAFVMYHYTNSGVVYQPIRAIVSCYVWLTGFGNGLYFWRGGSTKYTLGRFWQR